MMLSLRNSISCSSSLDSVCILDNEYPRKIAWMSRWRRWRRALPGVRSIENCKQSYIYSSFCLKTDNSAVALTHPDLLSLVKKSARAQRLVSAMKLPGELDSSGSYWEDVMAAGTDLARMKSARGDHLLGKLRSQLGVISPIPLPIIDGNFIGFFVISFFICIVFYKLLRFRKSSESVRETLSGTWPQMPTSFSMFLEKDLQRKESVEWVNMVLGKLWKVYRSGIEDWVIGILQPVIDNLQKPAYVQRVEIAQFLLGDEPLSVRNVERRTSRRVNDLQYHIGLRYTGGARMLLSLSLNLGIFPIVIPVGVRDFDIDGELWVKLRLTPNKPYIGAVSWAFVSLPKIKIELSPFRLFNLMGIPVFSMFLCKLLTEDLPSLFVRPRKIVLEFQKGNALGPVTNTDTFQAGTIEEENKDFVGELSVTLVDARKLSFLRIGRTDPYVVLKLGDQMIRSKKNSQTTVIGSPGQPIWNQDFLLFVSNPRKQRLQVEVIDSVGFKDFSIGAGEVELGSLQDTVPSDQIVTLQSGFTFFGIQSSGEILLRLTYKAYVEDEDDDWAERVAESEISADLHGVRGITPKSTRETESFMTVLANLLASDEFQDIVKSEMVNFNASDKSNFSGSMTSRKKAYSSDESLLKSVTSLVDSNASALAWVAVITCIAMSIVFSMWFSAMFDHP